MWTIEIKITNIKKNTPAAYSDISAGDILVSVNGVANYSDIIQLRNAFTEEKLELEFIQAKNNKVKNHYHNKWHILHRFNHRMSSFADNNAFIR